MSTEPQPRAAHEEETREAAPRQALHSVRLLLAIVSAGLLFAMMGVTVVDVIGRYFLNRPLPGATELTELLLAGVIFTGLPAVCLDDGHVTVDLLTARFAAWTKPIRILLVRLVSAGALMVIGWRLFVHAQRLAVTGEVSVFLRLPVAPVAFTASALCFLSVVLILAMIALRADDGGTLPYNRAGR